MKVTYYKPNVTRDYKRLYVPRGTSISDMADGLSDFTENDKWYIEGTSEQYDLDAPVEEEIVIVNAAADNSASFKDTIRNIRKDKDNVKIIEAFGSLFLMFMLLFVVRFSTGFGKGVR